MRKTGKSPRQSAPSAGLAGKGGSAWNALAWGASCLALAVAVWWVARRRGRLLHRFGIYALGSLALVVLLFFFFQSLSPLLPASY